MQRPEGFSGWCELMRTLHARSVAPATTVAHLLQAGAGPDDIVEVARHAGSGEHGIEVQALARTTPDGCVRVAELLRWGDACSRARSSLQYVRGFFDRCASASSDAAAALYSLGRPELLEAHTAAIVAVLRRWRVVRHDARILDVGCGTGRVTLALEPFVVEAWGVDISRRMIREARQRAVGRNRAHFEVTSGSDLSAAATGQFSLVVACDSFPYMVNAGVQSQMLSEIARVLRPGGVLAVFHYSYRGSEAVDRAELEQLSNELGFELVSEEHPFTHWDAPAFKLVRG